MTASGMTASGMTCTGSRMTDIYVWDRCLSIYSPNIDTKNYFNLVSQRVLLQECATFLSQTFAITQQVLLLTPNIFGIDYFGQVFS